MTDRWCPVCKKWKKKLCSFLKHLGAVRWTTLESWKWPTAYEHIVPVFLNTAENVDGSTINLSDLTVACKIWKNCKEVNINPVYVSNVQKARNDVIHSREVTSLDKERVFDALRDVLKDPDVTAKIDSTVCLEELAEIQKGGEIRKDILVFKAKQEQFQADLTTAVSDISKHVNTIRSELDSVKSLADKKTNNNGKNIFLLALTLVLGLFVIAIVLMRTQDKTEEGKQMAKYESIKDCVSEDYRYPFPQDLPLLGYLHDHSNLVGRKWLLREIENELLKETGRFPPQARGSIISADIGYGKSAIMHHILCATENQKGHRLRQHMVAFHICKFDVPSTQSPERFIRRLVGFFATKSAEYGSIISMLPNNSVLYNRAECGNEIEACFDQAFRFPFKEMNGTDKVWLIGIDALDECYSSKDRKNPIMELLSSRIMYFPKWIKFFITSRHFEQLRNLKVEKLRIKVLSSKDPNNIEDITAYINEAFPKNKKKLNEFVVENLINKSDGNFLYIIHALQFIRSQSNFDSKIPDVPETLEEIYEYNFDRHFSKGQTFGICKMILEVICTSLKPITADTIFQILKDESSLNGSQDMFEKEFRKLFFFINVDGTITIKHKAVHSWLLDENNQKYRISLKSGHDLFSKYLIKQGRNLKLGNIVDLVIHLSKSGNEELRNLYESVDLSFDRYSVHDLINRTDSADALGLLLKQYDNVDLKDENQMTPAFLAASNGHLEQLKLLHRKGADITFQVPGCKCITLKTTDDEVEKIEMRDYTGYTLLHIAAQHNFLHIAKFLTDQNDCPTFMNITNSVGLRAADIACKYGNLQILKLIHERCGCLVDRQCVYFAVKNGHKAVVKYAFKNGFKDKCITTKKAQRELKSLTEPCKCTKHHVHRKRYKKDVIWLIRQETMLHTAIINGFDGIAEIIFTKQRYIEKCSDAFGYTPQLLAIKHGMINLLKHLFRKAFVSTCTSVANHIKEISEEQKRGLRELITVDSCPIGGNFAHILAIYDRIEILALLDKLHWVDWKTRDENGNMPVHYAVCSSLSMVRFYRKKFGTTIFLEKGNNGASAFHLAGLCNNNNIVKEITNGFSEDLTQLALHNLQDRAGRNILHYVASVNMQSVRLHGKHRQYSALSVFLYFAKYINLTDVDFQGNGVAHFLVQNGHLEILEYYLKTLTITNFRAVMILPQNKQGLRPVEFGLLSAPVSNYIVTSDILYAFKNKLVMPFEKSEGLQNAFLWEVCLIMLSEFMTGQQIETFAESTARLMILKAPFLTKAVFRRLNLKQISAAAKDIIRKGIIESIKYSKRSFELRSLTRSSLLAISLVKASIFHTCSVPLMASPIHYMILNSLEYDTSVFNTSAIEKSWKSIKNKVKLNCRTSEGYNILHYALIGGNIDLVIQLKAEGVQLLTENLTAVDILYRLSHARFTIHKSSFAIFDRFASEFIEENQGLLTFRDFCHNGSRSLSLIHILVINGMNKTVEKITDVFGIKVLRCFNTDGFSPGYFALLFERTYLKLLTGRNNVKHTDPNPSAEESLIANLINLFPLLRHKSAYTSLVRSTRPMNAANTRSLTKLYRDLCKLFKTYHSCSIFNEFCRDNLVYFRQGLYLFKKLFISTKALQGYMLKTMNTNYKDCSRLSIVKTSIRKAIKHLQSWSEIQHRSLVWTLEYPFLKNIQKILHLSEETMILQPVYTEVSCIDNDLDTLRHILSYLQKASNVFVINMKDIYLLINLFEQKSYRKLLNFPLRFSDHFFNKLVGRLGFEYPYYGESLTFGAVYKINKFRYLNQIAATIAYKEIIGKWNKHTVIVRDKRMQLQKKLDEMDRLLTNTRFRKKWIETHFTCEKIKCGCCQTVRCKEEKESQDQITEEFRITEELYTLNIPYI